MRNYQGRHPFSLAPLVAMIILLPPDIAHKFQSFVFIRFRLRFSPRVGLHSSSENFVGDFLFSDNEFTWDISPTGSGRSFDYSAYPLGYNPCS
jgi:hypothetical protein